VRVAVRRGSALSMFVELDEAGVDNDAEHSIRNG
jgi:hypothetical protein